MSLLVAGFLAAPMDAAAARRFELSAAATIAANADPASDFIRMQSTLAPAGARTVVPPGQTVERFEFTDALAAASTVCYNDTILRDDFDADGF